MEQIMVKHESNVRHFWDIRSAKYDKLFWTKDEDYIQEILNAADLKKEHLLLDVGTGTGVIANAAVKLVKKVTAIDVSDSMLKNGQWNGVSVVNWDIGENFFADNLFHRVMARMVFHHILDNLDRAIIRCYDLLKDGGKIVIAEGVPPVDDKKVVDWYTEMFKYKEERRTFILNDLIYYLRKNGFQNIKHSIHIMEDFNINNWLENSGLDSKNQEIILNMHLQADKDIKKAYNMRVINGECLVRTKNVIVTGEK